MPLRKGKTSEPSLLEHIANIEPVSSTRKHLDLLLANYHQEKQLNINEANTKIMSFGKLSSATRWIMLKIPLDRLIYLIIWRTIGLNYLSRSIRMHFC